MDSTERTASDEVSVPANSRRLQAALLVVLALIALGWLVLSVQTTSGPAPDASSKNETTSRNAQGPIRAGPPSRAAQDAEGSSPTLAGLKLEPALRTPIPAQPDTARAAAAGAEE